MRKILISFTVLFTLSNCVFAQGNVSNSSQVQTVANVIYHEHGINMPIYVTKGSYTYLFDKFGEVLGYFRKTPGGRLVRYDGMGKELGSYKISPTGRLLRWDEDGTRIN